MKATGMVRPMDSLGRVVIPMEFRNMLGLGYKAEFEINILDDSIMIKPYKKTCNCGESNPDNLITKGNLIICKKCITELYTKIK